MSALADMTAVVLMACELEHRSNAEQDALLRVAASCDTRANRLTVANHRTGPASRLYPLVDSTRVLVDDQARRWNAKTAAKLEEQAERWEAAR